jgi:mono/diheme cytochrome c family protein
VLPAPGARAVLAGVVVASLATPLGLRPAGLVHASSPQAAAGARVDAATDAAPQAALVMRYCVTCHNDRLKTAGLLLDPSALARIGDAPEVWERVAAKLRMGAMPPPGAARPDRAALDGLTAWIEGALDRGAEARPDPGRASSVHRLNRAEYRNAVRDLLALDVDVATLLPGDDIDEQGFDNMADVLTVSPLLFERYLAAARKLARLAVGRPPLAPSIESYKMPILLAQDDRMADDLPFGSRGGAAIGHYFPVDGEYEIGIRLQRNYVNYIRGLGTRQQLDVRLDGTLVKRFGVGGEAKGRPAPASYAGNIFGDPEWEEYALYSDAGLTLRLKVPAGPRTIGVSFARTFTADEGVLQPRQSVFAEAINDKRDGDAAIEEVTIGGPLTVDGPGDTPSRRRIFVCRPDRGASTAAAATSRERDDERVCARRILSHLARRAYRRPARSDDVDTLMTFYAAGRMEGSFDAGIQAALERLLIAPDFLFRLERDPAGAAPGTVHPVGDIELASRLSFFLWSSIPDDTLLDLAERGELRKRAVLEAQVSRMLADERSRALVDNFAGQWLRLRDLPGLTPDPIAFPEFDENLREAFRRETELLVESQLGEDRSVAALLDAGYTFVNERLARHYGIPNVYGSHFRRVPLSGALAARRGGILGHGSLLAVTSYPNRTSPVLRGKWVLANMFGTPPPPPPPNVSDLPARGEGGEAATVRERMAQHRKNAACAVCHAPMDPMGLALENYDAIGAWRTAEGALPIDVSAELPDGTRFDGPDGLRTLLVERREQFVRTVTEKLLSYATGRPVGHSGRAHVRAIVRRAAAEEHRWSALIREVVQSVPFRLRRTPS